ncbi:ATP-binding cassette domain-containing protein [Pusillimonas sp. TS35]|nr:ATP-binding cassette domain-containing protein [Pusillimonas sp. TS35]
MVNEGVGAPGACPLIQLSGIRKAYGGTAGQPHVEVLRGIELSIHAGEFVAVVGASGSGKSTLMHILGCLDRPSAGTYRFGGRDVGTLSSDELAALRRSAFGFVFQGYHLISTETAQENVEVPAVYAGWPQASRSSRAAVLLAKLGLEGKLGHRPHQLSGGQQQRVSIARALMNGGSIILADEPTGALDTQSGAQVMALLRELAAEGHTVVLITHDRAVAAQASRIIEISDGCIVSDSSGGAAPGPPEAGASGGWLQNTSVPLSATEGASIWADLREAARGAWRGMCVNRVRTALTLLGIVIGVAAVIVMLAVGEGARQRVAAQMGTLGTNIMYLGSRVPPSGGPAGTLTPDDLDAIAHVRGVHRVMPVIGDPVSVRYRNAERSVYVFSASHEMPDVHHWRVAVGRYYTRHEDLSLAPVAVLGSKAHAQFFPDGGDPLGRLLLIGNSPFEIIGVMSERGSMSGAEDYDRMVFIPYQSGRARVYQAQTQPDYVVIDASAAHDVLRVEKAVQDVLRLRHGGREDFSIANAAAWIRAEMATRDTMTMMLGLIALVSLAVGGIGVMNVMLMTVRERTREIGIRVATGARERDILRQFLTESMLLTLMGGVAGIVLAVVVCTGLLMAGVPAVVSVRAMAGAFGCAIATGLLFGYMPARTAARLDPVVALAGV